MGIGKKIDFYYLHTQFLPPSYRGLTSSYRGLPPFYGSLPTFLRGYDSFRTQFDHLHTEFLLLSCGILAHFLCDFTNFIPTSSPFLWAGDYFPTALEPLSHANFTTQHYSAIPQTYIMVPQHCGAIPQTYIIRYHLNSTNRKTNEPVKWFLVPGKILFFSHRCVSHFYRHVGHFKNILCPHRKGAMYSLRRCYVRR